MRRQGLIESALSRLCPYITMTHFALDASYVLWDSVARNPADPDTRRTAFRSPTAFICYFIGGRMEGEVPLWNKYPETPLCPDVLVLLANFAPREHERQNQVQHMVRCLDDAGYLALHSMDKLVSMFGRNVALSTALLYLRGSELRFHHNARALIVAQESWIDLEVCYLQDRKEEVGEKFAFFRAALRHCAKKSKTPFGLERTMARELMPTWFRVFDEIDCTRSGAWKRDQAKRQKK